MMGRIKALNVGNAGGVIQSQTGERVTFEVSAVLAYDVACLAVGSLVSFDLEHRNGDSAVNVCVRATHKDPAEVQRRPDTVRYVGFKQSAGTRTYEFERVSPADDIETMVVTTDLALFARYRVPIQEGPALCMKLLQADMDNRCRSLTEGDMITYVATRVAPELRFSRRAGRAIRRPA
jgi:cold shock CspA family protein